MNSNTNSIEDVINSTLDMDQRLVPYLKLKGHVTYKAMKLCGQYMSKMANILKKHSEENDGQGIMTFNSAMGYLRSEPDEAQLMEEMGLEAHTSTGMWETISALVRYANKLNFDCQELLDPRTPAYPEGRQRTELGSKWKPGFGVTANAHDRRASWVSGLEFHKEEKDPLACATYAEFVTKMKNEGTNPDFILSEDKWSEMQVEQNVYNDFGSHLVDALMSIGGTECCEFDELPLRAQIAAIESLRGKLGDMVESAHKRVRASRQLNASQRTAEASKVQGLILGMDKDFRAMLDSSRYAGLHEFMYNYIPTGVDTGALETRDMALKSEAAVERSSQRRKLTGLELKAIDDAEKAEAAARSAEFGKVIDPLSELISDAI